MDKLLEDYEIDCSSYWLFPMTKKVLKGAVVRGHDWEILNDGQAILVIHKKGESATFYEVDGRGYHYEEWLRVDGAWEVSYTEDFDNLYTLDTF